MQNIILSYHCNSEEKINEFVSHPNHLIISEHKFDDFWGGKGMYFWDNLANAKYWKTQKKKKCKIVKACISFEEEDLLDLTDLEIEKTCQQIIKIMQEKGIVFDYDKVGKKIDYICKLKGYALVKFFGEYKSTPSTGFLNNSRISNTSKLIYCVKPDKHSLVSEREVL